MTEAGQPEGAGVLRYLKEAFTYRWNLLLFGAGAVAAFLSGSPDIALPLLGAAELAYLAGLTAIPRFRAAIDAKAHKEAGGGDQHAPPQRAGAENLLVMLRGLEPERRKRFAALRHRCVEMRRIAHGVGGRASTGATRTDQLQTPALDRLLWVFLRLLFSQQALGRFLESTDADAIEVQLAGLRERSEKAASGGDERIVRSLADSVATAELRLENYRKAEANAEFVDIELDRIEGKIQALTEMAVSHEDPDYISSQVDSVADSMVQTEHAIRELNYITGLTEEAEAPEILSMGIEQVMEEA